jgi:hypothetical protein
MMWSDCLLSGYWNYARSETNSGKGIPLIYYFSAVIEVVENIKIKRCHAAFEVEPYKKQLHMSSRFIKITSLSAMLAFSIATDAQDAVNSYAVNRPLSAVRAETPEAVPVVNATAAKNFTDEYGELANESWSEIGQGSRARFLKSGVIYLVDYDKIGNWISTVRIYQAQELPVNLQKMIRANYHGYSILTTSELTAGENQAYFVQIQNETTLRTLSIVDGEVRTEKKYDRADK